MSVVVLCLTALLASCLTFFTGFGLGTLLMPVFAVFFPVDLAVAMTAIVHLLNGLFKLALVGRHARLGVVLRFGLPAIVAAFAGARVLLWFSGLPVLHTYELSGRTFEITAAKLGVGALMVLFAAVELAPRTKQLEIDPRYLPLGGVISGFFGGLSGHQGAFRAAFLARSGLDSAGFVATGAVIAAMIDASRLSIYYPRLAALDWDTSGPLIAAAVASAFAGAFVGARLLKKVTIRGVQLAVSCMLFALAVGLMAGLL